MLLLYSTSKSLDALERIEIHLDAEVIRVDFTKRIPLSEIDLKSVSDVYGEELDKYQSKQKDLAAIEAQQQMFEPTSISKMAQEDDEITDEIRRELEKIDKLYSNKKGSGLMPQRPEKEKMALKQLGNELHNMNINMNSISNSNDMNLDDNENENENDNTNRNVNTNENRNENKISEEELLDTLDNMDNTKQYLESLITIPDISDESMDVVVCPPDLFPLVGWMTETRRDIAAWSFYYVWPVVPILALAAVARWHLRSPPGLANYLQDQLKAHVIIRRSLGSPVHMQSDKWRGNLSSRSCNIKMLLTGSKHTGTVHIVGYRDGSKRWLFPNVVLMIDNVKHDHYREIQMPPFETEKYKH